MLVIPNRWYVIVYLGNSIFAVARRGIHFNHAMQQKYGQNTKGHEKFHRLWNFVHWMTSFIFVHYFKYELLLAKWRIYSSEI